jgi:hypothetical protein
MDRTGFNNVNFFTGIEVEHTPATGQMTLFVVGVQPVADIEYQISERKALLDKSKHITHIYFGANQSFPTLDTNDGPRWRPWEDMIKHFLDQGYLCTLDIDVSCVEGLLESGLTEQMTFIPMISVKLPYLQQLGYNATIKLDDKDFQATNPGVWCHSLHDLLTRDTFTDWSQYTKDEPV